MLIKALLFTLLSITVMQASHSLELNGIGSYEQLRKEFYIGALYLSQPSNDPEDIRSKQTTKRMALRVTTRRWSPRRWSLQWQNDIAINNTFDEDSALTEQLMLFTGFLSDNLILGDEIIIDYIADKGTVISINGVTIIETQSDKLFVNLLNAWIGKLPPSGEFKTDILNINVKSRQALLTRYNEVTYNEARTAVIASWIQAKKDRLLAEKESRESNKQAALDLVAAAAAKKARDLANAAALAKQQQIRAAANAAAEKRKRAALANAANKKGTSSPAKKAKTKAQIAAENQYYVDLYRWQLTRKIHSDVVYPIWAKNFGQKGKVTLSFDVDKNAQISNMGNDDSGVSELLIAELKRAITSMVPLVLAPDGIQGDRWTMSVSYNFDPRSDDQDTGDVPQKPDTLLSTEKISTADYKTDLKAYQQNAITLITNNITYPVWAKELKKKGKVAVEVVINSDGTLNSINDKIVTRHQILNQALRDAVERSFPLPLMPEELKLNTTRIMIEHNFK